jgi:hypothetical protein
MRGAAAPLALSAALAAVGACHAPAPRLAGGLDAACPRDARPDAAGRCACDPGDVPVLGACVPPPVADRYCGPAARAATNGACVYPSCDATDAVDIDDGCTPLIGLLRGGPSACPPGASLVVEERRAVCISADAACPRGTRASGTACVHPPACPPGTLATARACRPVVLRGPGEDGATLVDLGAWAAVVLGVDGGPASSDLCRPLQSRPLAWGLGPGDVLPLTLHVVLSAPDADVTRIGAEVRASTPLAGRPLPPGAANLAEVAVSTLLEPLRGLGGQASAARVEVEVRCDLGSPRAAPP